MFTQSNLNQQKIWNQKQINSPAFQGLSESESQAKQKDNIREQEETNIRHKQVNLESVMLEQERGTPLMGPGTQEQLNKQNQ
ncbi:UNKNOWN [Stylonychia lemnae]|uniref:Uncharacterized protein n=1 Tax=Stylonychia lemnae TaxID=5949 RepID=A0A078AVU5_STYLE|nr:UNKNOWN [Stylonychia lemnae]|eukprot:CDW84893.1 UNKNOWN [Stylonychia lemnae]